MGVKSLSRLDRQSPTPPNFRLDRTNSKLDSESPPMTVDSGSSNYADAINLRLSANESPIDVDSNNDYDPEVRVSVSFIILLKKIQRVI